MMMRRMCGVSLKDRKCSVDLYSLLGIDSMAEVVRRGRLRVVWACGAKSRDNWVSACRNVVVAGVIIIIIIIIISLTSIFFQDKSRVWMAASQQH